MHSMHGNDGACSPEHRALRPCLGATTRCAGDEAEQAVDPAAEQAADPGASPGRHRRCCEPDRPGRDGTSGVGSRGPDFLWYGR